MGEASARRRGAAAVVACAVTVWALAGGVLLLALVTTTVVSVLGAALFDRPFPGDFELVQMGTAVAAFAFLPYAQLTGANVKADIFTQRASARTVALFACAASGVAFVFACLLLWRMSAGMADYLRYRETTAILQIPHWIAFLPILASLALLAAASVVSLVEARRELRRRGRP